MNIIQVRGLNCPKKYLLMIDGNPIVFCNSKPEAQRVLNYLYNIGDLEDKKLKKLLEPYRIKE